MSENPIKKRRKAQRLSQQQLADRVGCSRSYISQMESGIRPGSRAALINLARAFDCKVDELLDEPKRPQQAADRPVTAEPRKMPKAPPTAAVAVPKIIREFERLQDRRRQLVADLGVVDARLETLLRVV